MAKRVTVLMGGKSAEREISLVSGNAASKALAGAGYEVTALDMGNDVETLVRALDPAPDVVFNALHGRWGEDGCVQGLLNLMGIAYTHSGVAASAVAMNKPLAKAVFKNAGLSVAEEKVVTAREALAGDVMDPPYVLKPVAEGSSVGVFVVKESKDRPDPKKARWRADEAIMVERFIPGRELTVSVMGDKALAVTEITTRRDFYDYEAKYAEGGSDHVLPADIPAALTEQALKDALTAHEALVCRGVSRTDFRFDGKSLVILELNTQPGLTPTSLVPEQAAHAGIGFEDLVRWMVENAEVDQ